jgi:hypothetical protein
VAMETPRSANGRSPPAKPVATHPARLRPTPGAHDGDEE